MNTKLQSFASLIASLSKELKGQKTPQMQSTSVHGGTVQHYDNGGQPTLAMGLTGDGTHAVIYQTGPIPPAPTNVEAVGGQLQVVATWDGTFDNGAPAPNDFDLIEVHAGATSDFTPDTGMPSTTRVGEISHPQGSSVTFMATPGEVWVTMVTRTKSGAVSAHAHVSGTTVADAVDPSVFVQAQADLADAKTQIAQAQADLATDKDTLTTLQGNLGAAQTNITSLQSEQSSLSSRIQQASQDASNALSQTTALQTSASGGNIIFWSHDPASASTKGTKTNDVWYQITTDQTTGKFSIIAEWQWDGGTWQPVALAESFLPLVNIGTGTYGQLEGDRIVANSITTKELVAQDVAAGLGEFLKVDVGQITANSATMDSATVNALWANLFTANKVTAQQIDSQSIAAATATLVKIDASQITVTGTSTFANAVVQQLWTQTFAANKITADQIDSGSISAALATIQTVKAENIQSGFLNASLGIGTTGAIMAGNWSGTYARIDQTGFSTWNVAADGKQYLGTSLGSSSGSDALEIADSTGVVQAAIAQDGSISGSTANFDGDVIAGGTPIVGQAIAQDGTTFGWLDSLPQGIVQGGYGDFTGLVAGNGLTNTSATLGLLTVDCEPGRIYRFTMPVAYYVRNNSSADITCKVTAYYTVDSGTPADPTTSSSPLAIYGANYSKSFSYVTGGTVEAIYNSPATTPGSTMKILLVAQVNNAEMDFSVMDAGQWKAWVEDLGPAAASTARVAAALSGQTATTNGSTTDSSKLVEKRTFTTTWVGSASQIFNASGSKYNFSAASRGMLGQGSFDGTSGNNMRSAVVFNSTAVSGESASMANALNGATVTKAQVYLYFPHWYSSAGGKNVVHPLGGTSLPSSLSSVSSSSVTTAFTAQGQGVWVTVPNSWFTTSNTGITVTAPDATVWNYGYFAGPGASTASQRVQVRLTYTR